VWFRSCVEVCSAGVWFRSCVEVCWAGVWFRSCVEVSSAGVWFRSCVEVCWAGVWFRNCVEACSPSFSLILLRRGGGASSGHFRPKHVVVHLVIKYTSCDTVVFDYTQFPSFTHTTGMTHFLHFCLRLSLSLSVRPFACNIWPFTGVIFMGLGIV